MKTIVTMGLFAGLMLVLGGMGEEADGLRRYEYKQRHMGVTARLVLFAPDSASAARAAAAAFARIAALDEALSDYRRDSELMRLCARAGSGPVRVGPDLLLVLGRALDLAAETGGAFDPTAGPLVALWRETRRTGRLPHADTLAAARARVGWRLVRLDEAGGTVALARPGMRLDLGAIAKGFAVDEALAALRAHGLDRALAEMGGEIAAGAPPPGRSGWRIALEHADEAHRWVTLAHAAVASSGSTEQYVEVGGVRYSHVVDPRTGLGLTHRLAATVVAPDGLTADGLATAATLLDAGARAAFVSAHPEARFYVREAR